jgi:hypothetical protein
MRFGIKTKAYLILKNKKQSARLWASVVGIDVRGRSDAGTAQGEHRVERSQGRCR